MMNAEHYLYSSPGLHFLSGPADILTGSVDLLPAYLRKDTALTHRQQLPFLKPTEEFGLINSCGREFPRLITSCLGRALSEGLD